MERMLAWDDSMVGEQAVHGTWRFAKDFSVSGLKVGVLHTQAPEVRTAARALAYFAPVWQRILRCVREKILPGTAFACPEPGRFRPCRATDASTVATGINRLIRALETS